MTKTYISLSSFSADCNECNSNSIWKDMHCHKMGGKSPSKGQVLCNYPEQKTTNLVEVSIIDLFFLPRYEGGHEWSAHGISPRETRLLF